MDYRRVTVPALRDHSGGDHPHEHGGLCEPDQNMRDRGITAAGMLDEVPHRNGDVSAGADGPKQIPAVVPSRTGAGQRPGDSQRRQDAQPREPVRGELL